MRSTHRALSILCLAALAGCASATPPITYYLLRGEQVEGSGPIEASVRAGLGQIVVAAYLMGPKGIVVETAPGEVRPAFQHQWAEPLAVGLRWYLASEISALLGYQIGGVLTDRQSWDYTVDISVARLHATMEGRAVLEAEFVLTPSNREETPSQGRFSKSIPLPEEGYPGVVAAERVLVSEFADQIAAALRGRIEASRAASES
jgi:uncharacterized lipoprotein YmbA